MTINEIIDGLQMTIDLCLYNPNNGETITEPRNDMDKTTVDACEGAIKALEELQAHREAWEKVKSAVDQHTDIHSDGGFYIRNFDVKKIIAEYRPKEGDADAYSD